MAGRESSPYRSILTPVLAEVSLFFILFFLKINLFILFIYFWLRWVFLAMCGVFIVMESLVAEHGL